MLAHLAATLAGTGAGLLLAFVIGAWRGKKQRRINASFADFQRAVFDVQDHATFCMLCRPGSERVANDRTDLWRLKIENRDRALTAYLAAMGE